MAIVSLTLTPAYGRDYRTRQAAEDAWATGKDFVVAGPIEIGRYINKRDALRLGIEEVSIRFKGLREVTVVKVEPLPPVEKVHKG